MSKKFDDFYKANFVEMKDRWAAMLSKLGERLTHAVPKDWEVFTITTPDRKLIEERLLDNPDRKIVSKSWSRGSAYHCLRSLGSAPVLISPRKRQHFV